MLLGILLVYVLALINVALHELAHFVAAKYHGHHIDRFSIGSGPTIFKTTVAGVLLRLNLFPMEGHIHHTHTLPERTHAYGWQKVIVSGAGPAVSLLLLFVLANWPFPPELEAWARGAYYWNLLGFACCLHPSLPNSDGASIALGIRCLRQPDAELLPWLVQEGYLDAEVLRTPEYESPGQRDKP